MRLLSFDGFIPVVPEETTKKFIKLGVFRSVDLNNLLPRILKH